MRVAITGAAGQLGSELAHAFATEGWHVTRLARPAFTLERPELPGGLHLVVNAAAWTDVDGCARDPGRAMHVNGRAPGRLATAARASGARFIQISTNEVFEGTPGRRYTEEDVTRPVNAYGASKLAGERAVRAAHPAAMIVRTAWIFGGVRSFPRKILSAARQAAAEGRSLSVVADEIGNPTPVAELADRIVRLASRVADPPPVIHLAGEPPVSRYGWAARILAAEGLPAPEPISLGDYRRDSTPPLHAVLDSSLAWSIGLPVIEWELSPGEALHPAERSSADLAGGAP